MSNPYRVRSTHVFYEPHNIIVCEWQVLRRRENGTGWWYLVGSYQTEAEAIAVAQKLNDALLEETP